MARQVHKFTEESWDTQSAVTMGNDNRYYISVYKSIKYQIQGIVLCRFSHSMGLLIKIFEGSFFQGEGDDVTLMLNGLQESGRVSPSVAIYSISPRISPKCFYYSKAWCSNTCTL